MKPFIPPRIIDAGELTLRPFVPGDAQQLFDALLGDAAVTEWLPFATHRSVDESRTFIQGTMIGWAEGTRFTWALEDSTNRKLCALIELRPALPRAEIGVLTSRREGHRRRRAGLAVLLKLIDWLLAQPQLCRIHACCAPEGAAAGTMTRLGFTLEGRLENWEWRPNVPQQIGDALLFAKTRPLDAGKHTDGGLQSASAVRDGDYLRSYASNGR